ncbi:MAG TPA: helix-turn-helix domain-containing protein [Arthrobacter sp.]|nr:helix-turn-helix domain-containing protein [Arthrobacter sp.]
MENVQPASFGSGYPGPAPPSSLTPRSLTPAQVAVLDVLLAQRQPAGIALLSELTGLHSNTVREHLDALVKAELVSRTTANAHRRGRPSWEYIAAPLPAANPNAELALALAGELSRQAPDAAKAAIRAGRHWGAEESSGRTANSENSRDSRVARVIENLQQLGFSPDYVPDESSDQIEIRLHRCPMLSAAKVHPEITCNVHLGLVQGWLTGTAESGNDGAEGEGSADDLTPGMRAFAGSDYCLLTLRSSNKADQGASPQANAG